MRSFLKLAGPFMLAFFLAGIGWGVWSHKRLEQEMAKATPLRVLCAERWLSEDVLQEFSKRHNVPVQLWTYARPSELLRQMANSDGKVDVVCTSSLLVKSLIQSHWLMKTDYTGLKNLQLVSVDFQRLPYDAEGEYTVPLFWNLYGFFGKAGTPDTFTWKQVWSSKKVTLWGEELSLLDVLGKLGVNVEDRMEGERRKPLAEEVQNLAAKAAEIFNPEVRPTTADALMGKSDWILIPLGRVAGFLGQSQEFQFWLPEDGGSMDVGVLAIGAKSEQPGLAKELINDLLSTEHAIEIHGRLGAGVVHSTLNNASAIDPLHRADAIRRFPLNRFRFPDVNVEALPRFQKIYDETLASESNRKQ